jgi:type VI secretion system protein ImpE
MTPEELVRQGDLEGALAQLKDQVRAAPANAGLRIFLFQLLAVMGDWARARTHLDVAGDLDPSLLLTVNAYRSALDAEAARAAVFRGEQVPLVLGKPPEWLARLIEAQRLLSRGAYAQSVAMRDSAFEEAPARGGTLNGEAFEWLADADGRLGPCLEIILEGRYYWVPMANVREFTTEPPANLRDLVWMPAVVEWMNGGRSPVFIPARYPGTEASTDGALRLGRATSWEEPAEGVALGLGQRLFATDAADVGLCEVRQLRFEGGEDPAMESEATGG